MSLSDSDNLKELGKKYHAARMEYIKIHKLWLDNKCSDERWNTAFRKFETIKAMWIEQKRRTASV